jgi:hypothetical protein
MPTHNSRPADAAITSCQATFPVGPPRDSEKPALGRLAHLTVPEDGEHHHSCRAFRPSGFVYLLARRIASFDRRPIAAAKNLINQVSLPYADRLLDALNSFQTALMWPELLNNPDTPD